MAVRLHRQFAHPSSEKLIGLLKQNDANEEGLNNIKNITLECDICKRYGKAKPKPIAAFLLAKHFNGTIVMDLQRCSDSPKVCFLYMLHDILSYV